MIAIFPNLTFLQRPFLNKPEQHVLDLMGYVDTDHPDEAIEIWNNRGEVKNQEKIILLTFETLDKLPGLNAADILLVQDKPWMITEEGLRELDQQAFSQRAPTSIAEIMHRHMPFQVTIDLQYEFIDFLVDEYQVSMPEQIHDDMFLEWQEELKEKTADLC